MALTITSFVPAYGGGTVTTGAFVIIAPNIGAGFGITIADVAGLQAALDGKLNDVLTALGLANVITTGAELNFLAGVTSNVQIQLDGKVDLTGDTMLGALLFAPTIQLLVDAGTFLFPSIACVTDLDTGYFWPAPDTLGVTVGGVPIFNFLPVGLLTSLVPGYEALVAAPGDIPNKKYVDDEILLATSGSFLLLAGGTMAGAINMSGSSLTLDADFDTFIESAADDLMQFWAGGVLSLALDGVTIDAQTQRITDVVNPLAAQDAATMDYVDTEIVALSLNGIGPYLRLSGVDIMTGNLQIGGNRVELDGDADTFIESAADDLMQLWVGGTLILGMDGVTIDAKVQRITDVVNPVAAQDAATMDYVDTEIIALGLIGTGPYLRLSGVDTMVGALDMGTNLINNVVDPVGAQDVATMNYVDTEITALGLGGVTGPFLRLSGADTMAGDLDMGANLISDLGAAVAGTDALPLGQAVLLFMPIAGGVPATGDLDMGGFKIVAQAAPTAGTDGANKDYVDTEIAGLIPGAGGPFLPIAGGTMTGDIVTAAGIVVELDPGLATAPSLTFTGQLDAGVYADGTNINIALDGADAVTVTPSGGTNEVSVKGRRVSDVAAPTTGTDAVNQDFIDGLSMVKLLGSVSGVDLTTTGTTNIYTLPASKMHIITHIIVRATAYTPGGAPTNPVASAGLSPGSSDEFVDMATLDWGGIAGAADQAVYLGPQDGSPTPNSAEIVRFRVDTAAAGTFSALTATVYVLGIEL